MSATNHQLILSIFASFREFDGIAYHHIEGDLTYGELHMRACALSQLIKDSGDGPVIIWGHKHKSYLVSYWACLVAGRPLIPVEPDTPPQRVEDIVKSCGADLVLSTASPLLQVAGIRTIDVREFEESAVAPLVGLREDQEVAYIMYSSGSSGRPKGIKVGYANLAEFIVWVRDVLMSDTDLSAVSGNVRYCFDVSLFELWTAWTRKIPVSSLDHSEFINSRKYIDRYSAHGVGLWVSTPSTIQYYLRDPQFTGDRLPALGTFLFCGEVLGKSLVRELRGRFPRSRIVNTYGPTECTVAVTSVEISDEHLNADRPLPIGYPRDGCALSLDGEEILISGSVVGPGYVALPERQAQAFPSAGTYRTGDVGSMDGGQWYFHGRKDREIKLQGVRIDLNEIEDEIRGLHGVSTAFVEPMKIRDTLKALSAYVYGPGSAEDLQQLASEMARNLPPSMVPRFWYACERVVYNQNTKLDRGPTIELARNRNLCYVHAPSA